jgi:multifunctional methyltransferase subunit TRM112
MKLLTHNMLTSPGNARGYPLAIEAATVEEVETDFNAEFIARMVPKLEYQALLGALRDLSIQHSLPPTVPDQFAENEAFLKALHHVLVEVSSARARASSARARNAAHLVFSPSRVHPSTQVEVMEGQLVCPESGKKFPIKGGIPSMI